MKTNWLKLTNEINRKRYTIPDGWETRDQVAESLQCAPDKVADLLKPGVQSGDIERREFPVWDDTRRLAVRITCYRIATSEPEPAKTTNASLEDRIRASIIRNPTYGNHQIAKNIKGATSAMVAHVRETL
jgi:hypothetical protein